MKDLYPGTRLRASWRNGPPDEGVLLRAHSLSDGRWVYEVRLRKDGSLRMFDFVEVGQRGGWSVETFNRGCRWIGGYKSGED